MSLVASSFCSERALGFSQAVPGDLLPGLLLTGPILGLVLGVGLLVGLEHLLEVIVPGTGPPLGLLPPPAGTRDGILPFLGLTIGGGPGWSDAGGYN